MTKFALTLSAVSATLLTLAAPAVAAPIEPAATPTPSETAPASSARNGQRYCSVNRATGSYINRKICKTRDDWMASQGIDPRTVR